MQLLFVIKNTKLDNYLFAKDLTYIQYCINKITTVIKRK